MQKRLRTAALVTTLAAVVGISVWWISREPYYCGKALSVWLGALRSEDSQKQAEARAAFRAMGPSVAGQLGRYLNQSDSKLRRLVAGHHLRFRQGVSNEIVASGNVRRAMAASALGLVGFDGRAASDSINKAMNDESLLVATHAQAAALQLQDGSVTPFLAEMDATHLSQAIRAASVLYALGTNSDWIASELKSAMDRASESERFEAIQFVCRNELEPQVAWPVILRALEGKSPQRANALNAAMVQLSSSTATPGWATRVHEAIVFCLTDADVNVRGNAVAVLSISYPPASNLVPADILRRLQADSNPGIRTWAAGLQKEVPTPEHN